MRPTTRVRATPPPLATLGVSTVYGDGMAPQERTPAPLQTLEEPGNTGEVQRFTMSALRSREQELKTREKSVHEQDLLMRAGRYVQGYLNDASLEVTGDIMSWVTDAVASSRFFINIWLMDNARFDNRTIKLKGLEPLEADKVTQGLLCYYGKQGQGKVSVTDFMGTLAQALRGDLGEPPRPRRIHAEPDTDLAAVLAAKPVRL